MEFAKWLGADAKLSNQLEHIVRISCFGADTNTNAYDPVRVGSQASAHNIMPGRMVLGGCLVVLAEQLTCNALQCGGRCGACCALLALVATVATIFSMLMLTLILTLTLMLYPRLRQGVHASREGEGIPLMLQHYWWSEECFVDAGFKSKLTSIRGNFYMNHLLKNELDSIKDQGAWHVTTIEWCGVVCVCETVASPAHRNTAVARK